MNRHFSAAYLALLLCLGLLGPASARAASSIDAQSLGAALALPYLTTSPEGGARVTVATVTNALTSTPITLHAVWISGDPEDVFSALDYDCPLTPLETTYFVFEQGPDGTAIVTFECSDLDLAFPSSAGTNNVVTRHVPGRDGILFVSIECQPTTSACPSGPLAPRTMGTNGLLGDATVIDYAQGYAFSVGAIALQSGNGGLGATEGTGLGDRLYAFDGTDYAPFPAALTANYIAPDEDTMLELILFTLDGKANDGAEGVKARLVGFAFDDDENPTSGSVELDGFTVQDLTAPPPFGFGANIRRDVGGHQVGHLELFPTSVSATDAHENDPLTGSSDGARKRPVHGWIVQTTAKLGDILETYHRSRAPAAWARPLVQGTNPLAPLPGDLPSLHAGPPPF